jgi:hypothetical protein
MDDGSEQVTDQTTWNAFDTMNRETIVNGVSSNNGVTVTISGDANNAQGQQIAYDAAGRRIHVSQRAKGVVGGSVMGQPVAGSFTASSGNILTSESSFYDAAGRLDTMYREGAVADARKYDQNGHLLEAGQLGLDNVDGAKLEAMGISAQTRISAYDAGGRMVQQAVMGQNWRATGERPEATIGYDGAGHRLSCAAAPAVLGISASQSQLCTDSRSPPPWLPSTRYGSRMPQWDPPCPNPIVCLRSAGVPNRPPRGRRKAARLRRRRSGSWPRWKAVPSWRPSAGASNPVLANPQAVAGWPRAFSSTVKTLSTRKRSPRFALRSSRPTRMPWQPSTR